MLPAAGVIIKIYSIHGKLIVALGLARSMIMFVALGLASSSDDNSKIFPFVEY